MMIMRSLFFAFCVLLSAFCVLSPISPLAFAQPAPKASLRGVVTDPSGARIPGASVQLRGPAGEQTQTSDANGQYALQGLTPGRYDVRVTAADFKADQRQAFSISGTATLNFQLVLEGQTEVVNVQEHATTLS